MEITRVESDRFPYLPLSVTVGDSTTALEVLLDTGFDGDLVVPDALLANRQAPDEYRSWGLADGSTAVTPIYYGIVQLGSFESVPADIALLGDESIVGRGITDRYRIILDRGTRIIAEP